jgi:hypothetical protein
MNGKMCAFLRRVTQKTVFACPVEIYLRVFDLVMKMGEKGTHVPRIEGNIYDGATVGTAKMCVKCRFRIEKNPFVVDRENIDEAQIRQQLCRTVDRRIGNRGKKLPELVANDVCRGVILSSSQELQNGDALSRDLAPARLKALNPFLYGPHGAPPVCQVFLFDIIRIIEYFCKCFRLKQKASKNFSETDLTQARVLWI